MVKFKKVPFLLFLSATSFLLFAVFSIFVNHYSQSYKQKIKEVRREQVFASKRLKMANKKAVFQKRRADSLEVILKAQKNPGLLWTARAIYSETRRPQEMWYVGWVIRNRFEAKFRGDTYKGVILHPKQFSAFNRGNPLREFYFSLKPEQAIERERWHDALRIAETVVESPPKYNPLPQDTFFFYSERSMEGQKHPNWRWKLSQVGVKKIENERFRFFRKTKYVSSSETQAAR